MNASIQISNRMLDRRKKTEGASYFVTILKDCFFPKKPIELHKGAYFVTYTTEGSFHGGTSQLLGSISRRRVPQVVSTCWRGAIGDPHPASLFAVVLTPEGSQRPSSQLLFTACWHFQWVLLQRTCFSLGLL